ncbi:MAG: hypothetical protein HY645_07245 [Acidobacteria bacterium]|nr:hypothetical protein [Acidobacteriota bacterium]
MLNVEFNKEEIQRVVITYDPEITNVAAIKAVIEKGGDRVFEPGE